MSFLLNGSRIFGERKIECLFEIRIIWKIRCLMGTFSCFQALIFPLFQDEIVTVLSSIVINRVSHRISHRISHFANVSYRCIVNASAINGIEPQRRSTLQEKCDPFFERIVK